MELRSYKWTHTHTHTSLLFKYLHCNINIKPHNENVLQKKGILFKFIDCLHSFIHHFQIMALSIPPREKVVHSVLQSPHREAPPVHSLFSVWVLKQNKVAMRHRPVRVSWEFVKPRDRTANEYCREYLWGKTASIGNQPPANGLQCDVSCRSNLLLHGNDYIYGTIFFSTPLIYIYSKNIATHWKGFFWREEVHL